MSGRLNPREYDLGELRDAVRYTPPRGSREHRAASDTDAEPETDTRGGESFESTDDVGNQSVDDAARTGRPDTDTAERRPKEPGGSGVNRATVTRRTADRDRELLARLSPGVERPYLARLPDEYQAQLEIFEWLEKLLATTGREGALDALAYYESIGWLSERSHEHLVDFLDGLPDVDAASSRQLTVDDHRESLQYVARLAHRLS